MFTLNNSIDKILIFIKTKFFFLVMKEGEFQQNKNVLMIRKN